MARPRKTTRKATRQTTRQAAKPATRVSTGARRWQADPNDAIRLAALRWFALEIERRSIEIYATDRKRFTSIENLLRQALRQLQAVRGQVMSLEVEQEDCPMGYLLCKDGLCAPMCDWLANE